MAHLTETPLMKQYAEMKKKHPDAILLFRVGDFYETFSDDAKMVSDILGLTLTTRCNGSASKIYLAGFPHHALDTYLPKLVRAGKRVAICEQIEDPKFKKNFVKRGVDPADPSISNNKTAATPDLSLVFSILTAFREILNKLYIFDQIMVKSLELRKLAGELRISPAKAVTECCKTDHPSLFD